MIRTFDDHRATMPLNDPSFGSSDAIRLYFVSGYPSTGPLEVNNVHLDSMRNAIRESQPEDMLSFHSPDGKYYIFRRKHIKRWMPLDNKE